MSSPGDVTDNYEQIMRERGWSWDDLADEFERQAVGPPLPLDRGANALGMARWARSHADAAQERQAALAPADRTADMLEVLRAADGDPAARERAAEQRRDAQTDPGQPDPRPDDAAPDAPPRKAVPPRKRTA